MRMDFTGKKLLVLAGAGIHSKVVRAAKEMGIYTIVTDYLDPKESPAKAIADIVINHHNKRNLQLRLNHKDQHRGTCPQNSGPRLLTANECQNRTVRTQHVALDSRHASEAIYRTRRMPACHRLLRHTQRGHPPIPGLFASFSSLLEKLLPTIKDYISVLFKN